jgi:hypothetical protein
MKVFHLALLISCAFWNVPAQQCQPVISDPVEFDEYVELSFADENARLDNIAIQQQKNPDSVLYFIVYGGRNARRGEARAHALRVRSYLIKNHGIAPEQIAWSDGGYRERLTVAVWNLPRGYPHPSPTRTIPKAEVKPRDCKTKGSKT